MGEENGEENAKYDQQKLLVQTLALEWFNHDSCTKCTIFTFAPTDDLGMMMMIIVFFAWIHQLNTTDPSRWLNQIRLYMCKNRFERDIKFD